MAMGSIFHKDGRPSPKASPINEKAMISPGMLSCASEDEVPLG